MALLDDIYASDAAAACNAGGLGSESLVYHPMTGASIPFVGFVFREPPKEEGNGQIRAKRTVVHVPKSTVAAVNVGGMDQIAVADRKGGTAAKRTVAEILGQDDGMWKLRLA